MSSNINFFPRKKKHAVGVCSEDGPITKVAPRRHHSRILAHLGIFHTSVIFPGHFKPKPSQNTSLNSIVNTTKTMAVVPGGSVKRPRLVTGRAAKALIKRCSPSEPIYLQLSLTNSLTERRSIAPVLIKIPHSVNKPLETLSILLIVKDPQSRYQEALENDPKSPTKGIFSEIISVSRLKTRVRSEGPSYLDSFDLIIVEDKVASLVAPVLGQKYYKSGKSMPVPIATKDPKAIAQKTKPIDASLVKSQIRKIVKCTSVAMAPGTCLSVLVGHAGMGPTVIEENAESALELVVQKILPGKNGWDMVKGAHIKTPESAAVPIMASSDTD